MERLTFEGNFCDIAQCRDSRCRINGACTQKQVWEHLKAYEDTGLSPKGLEHAWEIEDGLNEDGYSIKRMVELMKADKERRVVILHCKVGDIVFIQDIESKTVADVRVQGISITFNSRVVLHFGGYPTKSAWGDRCGIDWFLTREEAEKALGTRKDG